MLVSPHAGHSFARTWYSATAGGGGGAASNTCRFCSHAAGTSARPCPQQPHAAGPHSTVSSGLPDCFSVLDCAPGCLPGLRPDLPRSDRSFGFFLSGCRTAAWTTSRILPSGRWSSSTRAASASICASRAASCAAASSSRSAAACRSRALPASSSATRACSHPAGSDGDTGGVSGTSRSPSEPAIRHQHDTPSRLTDQKPGPPRGHRQPRTPAHAPSAIQAE